VVGKRLDVEAVDSWADSNAVECLYYLAPGDDPAAAQAAESAGFRLMDVRVELARDAERGEPAEGIREANDADGDALVSIASGTYGTRFYADPNFPDDRCREFYDTWIRRSLEGWAAGVLVADADGAPRGYVSCHLDGSTGSIGLIAVAESARGSGLGADLSRAAVAWCAERGADRMTVVTQGRNVAALRTFHRAGFLPSTLDLWFHKWYAR
jgi:GNAT superfamily N-acetyltransferase